VVCFLDEKTRGEQSCDTVPLGAWNKILFACSDCAIMVLEYTKMINVAADTLFIVWL
jgi:hypothetical protein